MASLRDRDAGRDAESFDADRKEGRYPAGYFNVDPADVAPLSADKQAAVDAAVAQIERAFGPGAPVFGGAPAFVHGDFVRWHTAGYANPQKVLGQEIDKQGRTVLVLWDARTASCWSGPVEGFVRVEAPAEREAA